MSIQYKRLNETVLECDCCGHTFANESDFTITKLEHRGLKILICKKHCSQHDSLSFPIDSKEQAVFDAVSSYYLSVNNDLTQHDIEYFIFKTGLSTEHKQFLALQHLEKLTL